MSTPTNRPLTFQERRQQQAAAGTLAVPQHHNNRSNTSTHSQPTSNTSAPAATAPSPKRGTVHSATPATTTISKPSQPYRSSTASSGPNSGSNVHTLADLSGKDSNNSTGGGGRSRGGNMSASAQHTSLDILSMSPIRQGYLSDDVDEVHPPEYTGRPTQPGWQCFFEMFAPYHKLIAITTVIIILNCIYFAVELIYAGVKYHEPFSSSNGMGGPSSTVLRELQAKYQPDIVKGYVQRLLLPVFMHAGILHIVMNTIFFLRVGWLTEERFTPWCMLAIYLVGGVAGNAASTFLEKTSVSTGASGALFALLGANAYFVIRHWKHLRTAFCELVFLVMVFTFTLLIGFLAPSHTDNWAHLFGGIFGIMMGMTTCKIWHHDTNPKVEWGLRIGAGIFTAAMFILFIGLIWAV